MLYMFNCIVRYVKYIFVFYRVEICVRPKGQQCVTYFIELFNKFILGIFICLICISWINTTSKWK